MEPSGGSVLEVRRSGGEASVQLDTGSGIVTVQVNVLHHH